MMANTDKAALEAATRRLLDGHSLEISARDAQKLRDCAHLVPPGTQVNVTFMPNEDFPTRIATAATVRELGLVPVPHISARRIKSEEELDGFLEGLVRDAKIDMVFVIAGDPPEPLGPYDDALSIIRSGKLVKAGVKKVGISGYPEGHPDISHEKLRQAMIDKHASLREQGLEVEIMTQFGFDADPVFDWLKDLREQGIETLVRIGVAGPTSVTTLLKYAARCGVGTSAKVMAKYGLSITRVLGTAGPEPIMMDMAEGLKKEVHGDVLLHFYPFGGLMKTTEWIRDYRQA
jgi:methylenetetrahydrofolate reductase (NADPH)